jgi:hypothetical protein
MRLFTPRVGATFSHDGKTIRWRPGQLIEEGSPILKGRETLVRPIEVDYPAPPEAAAAPKPAAKKPAAAKA